MAGHRPVPRTRRHDNPLSRPGRRTRSFGFLPDPPAAPSFTPHKENQTMTHAVSRSGAPFSRPTRFQVQVVSALVLMVIADWLFYDQAVGVTFACFLSLAAAAVKLTSPEAIPRRTAIKGTAVFALSVLPSLEAFNLLAMALGLTGIVVFTLLVNRRFQCGFKGSLSIVILFVSLSPFRLISDLVRLRRVHRHNRSGGRPRPGMVAWVVPALLGTAFLALFTTANPIIADWLLSFSPADALDTFDLVRMLFWALMLLVCWPFIRVRLPNPPALKNSAGGAAACPAPPSPQGLFSPAAVMRGLVVFNLIFAAQTALDATFLWAGAQLPDGMTYATYALQGAYPLLIAAVLSALFVLAALRPGSKLGTSALVRTLVFAWIAQNIVLMISALLRLSAYVEFYSLTYWRVAAFVWMCLVAIGLALILLRIFLNRSNTWLVGCNLAAVAIILYGIGLANLPHVIASYNINHSFEVDGNGPRLDMAYLAHLGPQAIPAIERYLGHAEPGGCPTARNTSLCLIRNRLKVIHGTAQADWRRWGFRRQRLQWYINAKANAGFSNTGAYDGL